MSLGFSLLAKNKTEFDYEKCWSEAVAVLLDGNQSSTACNMWLRSVAVNSFENNTFNLVTPHSFAIPLLLPYKDEIQSALCKVSGKDVRFVLNYDENYQKKYDEKMKKEASKHRVALDTSDKKAQPVMMRPEVNLNLKYQFKNFVVGENSKMAFAVAKAVAEKPGQKYNPLFIYGASGLGKTHLMQAIGYHVLFNTKLRVKYIKTEEYVNEVISNLQKGNGNTVDRMDKFRQKFKNVDVLLLDDIQFIESKNATMKEVFYTFEMLHNAGKQIVITSDRLPKDIPTLSDRLRTRFEMGILVELTQPEYETRIAILQNLADKDNLNIPFEVYDFIAKNFKNNVRELEGAYNRISAFAEIEGADFSLEYAKKVLDCLGANGVDLTMQTIAQNVADYFEITVQDFKGSARAQKISNARQIVVYLIREILNESYENIAEFLNKKHPTMVYSYEKVKKEIETNRELKKIVNELSEKLKA